MQQSHFAEINPFTQRDFVARRMSHVFVASCKRALSRFHLELVFYYFFFVLIVSYLAELMKKTEKFRCARKIPSSVKQILDVNKWHLKI